MNYRAGKYNSSGYLDMTAYLALRQVQREERAAKKVHTRKTPAGKHREGGRRFRCKGGTKTMIGNDVAHNTPSAVQQRCYTVDDLRVILNVSRSTVYQLLKRNEFRWFQIGGGKYRISKKSFDDWLDCQS